MSTNRENLENPGIFVRILDDEAYQVRWADGQSLIETAYQEEMHRDDSIADFPRAGCADFLKRTYGICIMILL